LLYKLALLLTLACILCNQTIVAQDIVRTDSLNVVLETIKDPTDKMDILLKFLEVPETKYTGNILELANRAYRIAQQTKNTSGQIRSMIILGNYYFRISNYEIAMEYAQKSKEMSEDLNYSKELALSYRLIGSIYNQLGDYDNSAANFFKSLKLFDKLKDKEGISNSLGDIGMDFYNQQEYKRALYYYNNSLSVAKGISNYSAIKRQYNNIAVVYGDLQKYDTAIVFLEKALEISIKLGDKLGQGINIMNIGYDQMNLGEIDKAMVNFRKSLELFKELNNRLHMAECYLNFGYCCYIQKNISESIYYFELALLEGQNNRYHKIIHTAAKMLNQIHADKKDFVTAYQYQTLEKAESDSLNSFQKQKMSSKLELQYVFEKKEFEKKLAIQTQYNLMLIIIFSLVFVLVILGFAFSRHRLKSKFVVLEKEKIESELDIKNRELTVNLISLIKKNELLSEISTKLIQLESNASGTETKDAIIRISKELRNNTDDNILNEFSLRFQEVHAGFYEKLLKSYPDLSPNELKLCAYLRLNMSTKEIQELTGQRQLAIDQARYRLRKKLGLSNSETNLINFLLKI